MRRLIIQTLTVVFLPFLITSSTTEKVDLYIWKSLKVTATAYNSLKYQTSSQPNITAFGDSLLPGMKVIAVSRDLLQKGLDYNTPVLISGMPGVYRVKDKMNKRWKNRIDIYMGVDVKQAREWGRKKIMIHYGILKDSLNHISKP